MLGNEKINGRQVLVGMANATEPFVHVRQDQNNYVEMVGRPSSGPAADDPFFQVVAGGDQVFRVDRTGASVLGGSNNVILETLQINGTLTLSPSGKMTNPNEDFTITDNGIRVKNGTTYPSPRAYALVNSSDSVVANLWYNQGINEIRLQSSGPLLRILNGGGGDVEMASTTGNVLFRQLKTSDPGVAGAIWRDGTNLRISTG